MGATHWVVIDQDISIVIKIQLLCSCTGKMYLEVEEYCVFQFFSRNLTKSKTTQKVVKQIFEVALCIEAISDRNVSANNFGYVFFFGLLWIRIETYAFVIFELFGLRSWTLIE